MKHETSRVRRALPQIAAALAVVSSCIVFALVTASPSEDATTASGRRPATDACPPSAELALHPRFASVAAQLQPDRYTGWQEVARMQSQRVVSRQLADERFALELAGRIGRLCGSRKGTPQR